MGLANLKEVELYRCNQITGTELSSTLLSRTSLRKSVGGRSANKTLFLYNSSQATPARLRASYCARLYLRMLVSFTSPSATFCADVRSSASP